MLACDCWTSSGLSPPPEVFTITHQILYNRTDIDIITTNPNIAHKILRLGTPPAPRPVLVTLYILHSAIAYSDYVPDKFPIPNGFISVPIRYTLRIPISSWDRVNKSNRQEPHGARLLVPIQWIRCTLPVLR